MRILLTNEQVLVCSALRRWLEQESDFEVVGEATKVTNLVDQVQETKPHLLLLDWELPGLLANELFESLRILQHPPKIVAFSSRPGTFEEAIAVGADAFLSKEDSLEKLLSTLRTVGGRAPVSLAE